MATLTVSDLSSETGGALALVAAAAGGDQFAWSDDTWLVVQNAGAGAINVTLTAQSTSADVKNFGTMTRASLADGAAAGGDHEPSRPGAPPNSDTGALARSIAVASDPDNLTVTVSASAPHAADLEFGSSKIAERPFLAPAVEKHRAGIVKDVAAVLRMALR